MSVSRPARSLLLWHTHGSWTESFVAGRHRYLVPLNENQDANGRGLSGRNWRRAEEVPSWRLRDQDVDLVVLQRPDEIELAARWLGRRPGIDVPVADAVEQHTTVEPAPDDETSAESPDDMPLETTAADWQEQRETVELDPELDEFER